MSTRKLIKGDRYRAGLWKLEERCYEAHVRMPNAKFMIRTYRCTQGDANDMMRALEQVAKVTSPDTVYDVMEAPFKEAI